MRSKVIIDDVPLNDEFVRRVMETTAASYAELRANEDAWEDELAERAVLDGALSDRIED